MCVCGGVCVCVDYFFYYYFTGKKVQELPIYKVSSCFHLLSNRTFKEPEDHSQQHPTVSISSTQPPKVTPQPLIHRAPVSATGRRSHLGQPPGSEGRKPHFNSWVKFSPGFVGMFQVVEDGSLVRTIGWKSLRQKMKLLHLLKIYCVWFFGSCAGRGRGHPKDGLVEMSSPRPKWTSPVHGLAAPKTTQCNCCWILRWYEEIFWLILDPESRTWVDLSVCETERKGPFPLCPGGVGFWDLTTKSSLLQVRESDQSLSLLPYRCLLAHDHSVRSLTFCPASR